MEDIVHENLTAAILALDSSRGKVIAGGTDLYVQMAERQVTVPALVDISRIDELNGISRSESCITIGACTTIAEIAESDIIPQGLRQGARSIGSPQIRNLGTIGGNICNASPCGDTLAPLLCLDADFVLTSLTGRRKVNSGDFFTGPKSTVIKPNEMLEVVEIPIAALGGTSSFKMIGKRKGQTISQVNAAVWLVAEEGNVVETRIAVGSVAPVPLRLKALEVFLTGQVLESVTVKSLEGPINQDITPIDDVRSTEVYRRSVTVSLVIDALLDIMGQLEKQDEGANG